MRRGRPTAGAQNHHSTKPSPSPMRVAASDPFAALDGKSAPGPVDEISSRFPSLDQFSLLHHGGKFDFDASPPTKSPERDLGQRVTERLADDAFAIPQTKPHASQSAAKPSSTVSRAQKIISSNPELQAAATSPAIVHQPTPSRPYTNSYVSHGTMTSPTTSVSMRFPPTTADHHRSTSLPRNQNIIATRTNIQSPDEQLQPPAIPRIPSFSKLGHVRNISSSRPSLEGGRPSQEVLDPVSRTKSSNAGARPTSAYLESNMDYLREKEKELSGRPSMSDQKRPSYSRDPIVTDPASDEETSIHSNVDFLKKMEDKDTSKKHKRSASGGNRKEKRSSLPSMSLSGTKSILAGKFGDAFKRFENNANVPPGPRTPSPLQELERRDLTPIAGSEATDGRSDDGNVLDDVQSLNPEQRREIERRRLSIEERRVADAAAEYRKRLADRGPAPRSIGGVSRAASIQNKVKSLLDESSQSSPTKKTAEGYGRFTGNSAPRQSSPVSQKFENAYTKPVINRKPVTHGVAHARSLPIQSEINYAKPRAQPPIPAPATISKTGGPRPSAPPKPMHLNSINTGPQNSPPKPSSLSSRPLQARPDMSSQEKEDYIADFSKRFPSLSGIEMVERDIAPDVSRKSGEIRR
jgi:AP2-associated kinase